MDSDNLPAGAVLDTDICIVGAGPAGIILAREFNSRASRVILLEGGKLTRTGSAQALYKGDNVGLHYEDLHHSRSRYFGGSSNCWGGFCRPLDEHDFEVRDWMPNSGWPIRRSDLLPYYERAQELLQIGPLDYDPATWEKWIGRPDVRLLPLNGNRAINIIAQLSPPTRFGSVYRQDIAQSDNVSTYLNANVTEVETPGNGSRVTGVRVCTLSGMTFRVEARHYILAAGGIETPRLLLASNRHQPAGIGNQYDSVGRYFMDHPRLRSGTLIYRDPEANSKIYDPHVTVPGGIQVNAVKVAAYFGLTPETQRAERIGNTRCYAVSRYLCDDAVSYTAIGHLYRAVHGGGSLLERSPADRTRGRAARGRPLARKPGWLLAPHGHHAYAFRSAPRRG